METIAANIREKLEAQGIVSFNHLPNDQNMNTWVTLSSLCGLTLGEMFVLKNARFPVQSPSRPLDVPFEDLLVKEIPDYNPKILVRARLRFMAQMNDAVRRRDSSFAAEVYWQAEALPQTSTQVELAEEGIVVSDRWHESTNGFLSRCFIGAVPYVLKTLKLSEFTRCQALDDVMTDRPCETPHLTSFRLKSRGTKFFMLMPMYSSSLEMIPWLSEELGLRLFHQIREAVNYLHGLGFNHMDIKPANICMHEDGSFVLVDLGSVIKKGEYSESTGVYVPRDFQPRPAGKGNRYKAADINDWLMLGMTIAEKVFSLKVGARSAPPSPTINELTTILQARNNAFGELISLFRK